MFSKYLFYSTARTYKRLLTSFVLLLILPLVASVVLYFVSETTIEKEISNANKASLNQVKRQMDGKLQELFVLADQILLNEDVRRVSVSKDSVDNIDRLLMLDVQNFLRRLQLVNTIIEEIYVYIPEKEYILSNKTRYKLSEFESIAMQYYDMSVLEWEEMVLSGDYKNLHIIEQDNNTNNTFVFTQKLLYTGINEIPAIAVILVDKARLYSIMETLQFNDEGQIIIQSVDGKKIIQTSDDEFPIVNDDIVYSDDNDAFKIEYNNENYFTSSVKSAVADWYYYYILPSNEYLKSVHIIRKAIIWYILAMLIGEVIISFYLAKRNYSPIHKMAHDFLEKVGEINKESNEMEVLEESLNKILQENDNLSSIVSNQNATIQNSLLSKLIRGNAPQLDVLIDSCKACDINFKSEHCMLMSIVISEDRKHFIDIDMLESNETKDLIQTMITSVLKDFTKSGFDSYVVDVQGVTTFLIIIDNKEQEAIDDKHIAYNMINTADKIRKVFEDEFGIYLSFAISNVYHELTKLPIAYGEIRRILEHIKLYDEKNIVVHINEMDVDESSFDDINNFTIKIKAVINSIQMRNFLNAKEEVDKYIKANIINESVPYQIAKLKIAVLTDALLDAFISLKDITDVEYAQILDIEKKLSNSESVSAFQQNVNESIDWIKSNIEKHEEETRADIKKLIKFIKDNLNDSGLSVSSIAEKFDVSLSHISRWFKKETGVGLLHYINLQRVDIAKQLISNTNISLSDIALRVGFGSRITLVRVFKRYEGKSPSEFRQSR